MSFETTNHQNPDNCSSSQYLALDSAQPNFKAIWAQILSAHAQGQTVSLFYDGCIAAGNQNWPRIRAIAVPTVW